MICTRSSAPSSPSRSRVIRTRSGPASRCAPRTRRSTRASWSKITRTGSLKDAKTTVEGDTVTTTFGTDIGTFSNPGEKLSANSDYEKLTKGIDNPQAAAWVNVPQVLKAMDKNSSNGLPKQLKENLESISGIGMVAGQIDDHYFDSWVRVGTK